MKKSTIICIFLSFCFYTCNNNTTKPDEPDIEPFVINFTLYLNETGERAYKDIPIEVWIWHLGANKFKFHTNDEGIGRFSTSNEEYEGHSYNILATKDRKGVGGGIVHLGTTIYKDIYI